MAAATATVKAVAAAAVAASVPQALWALAMLTKRIAMQWSRLTIASQYDILYTL